MTTAELIEKLERAEASTLFYWSHNPSWGQEGGISFDGNWIPDCGGKSDYDPTLLRLNCRVYPDGDYVASLFLGEFEVASTGIEKAGHVSEARLAVEKWCATQSDWVRNVLIAALKAKEADNGKSC